MWSGKTIQLRDFCRLFRVPDRQVRYILEEGHVPDGVRHAPSTGNHREFDPGQAFWLGIVLKLKQFGLRTLLAAKASDYTTLALRGITQNLSWDWRFLPAQGWFDTEHQYFVEICDFDYIRLVTNACPSKEGIYQFDWHPVEGRHCAVQGVRPFVILRLDLVQIAEVLKKFEAWSHPDYGI